MDPALHPSATEIAGQITHGWKEQFAEVTRSKRLLILDYDGTLAHLAVEWDAVRRDLSALAQAFGFESDFSPLWPELARFKRLLGDHHLSALFQIVARHEQAGVKAQRPRPDVLDLVWRAKDEGNPEIAIFSMNLHNTVQVGVDALGLPVHHIMGCDDVTQWKPSPEGAQTLLTRTGIAAGCAVFAGDSHRDAQAAHAAGIPFVWV